MVEDNAKKHEQNPEGPKISNRRRRKPRRRNTGRSRDNNRFDGNKNSGSDINPENTNRKSADGSANNENGNLRASTYKGSQQTTSSDASRRSAESRQKDDNKDSSSENRRSRPPRRRGRRNNRSNQYRNKSKDSHVKEASASSEEQSYDKSNTEAKDTRPRESGNTYTDGSGQSSENIVEAKKTSVNTVRETHEEDTNTVRNGSDNELEKTASDNDKLISKNDSPESDADDYIFDEDENLDDSPDEDYNDDEKDDLSDESDEYEETVSVVGVRFKKSGKIYYFDPNEIDIELESGVIVETVRGVEFGTVVSGPKLVSVDEIVPPLKKVLRKATDEDEKVVGENEKKEAHALEICAEKIIEHKLPMKLIDVEYTFDNSKLIFYFTADGRVDFRELVKDLASIFRTRIELRQIGVRDEAKMIGGLGCCGRSLCCASFLGDFDPVSIKMAKEQNLSLNPTKISGVCGRLMCCLRYEYDSYRKCRRGMPKVGDQVISPKGKGRVVDMDILRGLVKIEVGDGHYELVSKDNVKRDR